MNILRTMRNSLIYKVLPPPISSCSIRRIPLLLCLSFLLLSLGLTGCEKPLIGAMQSMYDESCGLKSASSDSINSFIYKFNSYVSAHPESVESEYYAPTLENIRLVTVTITITAGDWADDSTVNF